MLKTKKISLKQLDRIAQRYANYLARTNQFKHSNRKGMGENLYKSWGGFTNPNPKLPKLSNPGTTKSECTITINLASA